METGKEGGGGGEWVRYGGRQGVRGENDMRHDQRLGRKNTTTKKTRKKWDKRGKLKLEIKSEWIK